MHNSVVASGYLVVDLLKAGNKLAASPGGTASNVANGLRSLGWQSSIAGTVGQDPAGHFFRGVLAVDGIAVTELAEEDNWTTPVIIQVEERGDHRWVFSCPHCGTRFAKHRPPSEVAAKELVSRAPAPKVFFFDRVSRYTVALAEAWRASGTCIVFEPSTLGRAALFERAVSLSHVVKYSDARSRDFESMLAEANSVLVRTSGSNGASYRAGSSRPWVDVPTQTLPQIVDSAGAGDWTTAGFVNELGADGDVLGSLGSERELEIALEAGVRLGAESCNWMGFRPPDWEVPGEFRDVSADFYCPLLNAPHRALVS